MDSTQDFLFSSTVSRWLSEKQTKNNSLRAVTSHKTKPPNRNDGRGVRKINRLVTPLLSIYNNGTPTIVRATKRCDSTETLSDNDATAPKQLGFSKARTDIPVSSVCILLKIIILFNKKILDMWAVESVSGGIILPPLSFRSWTAEPRSFFICVCARHTYIPGSCGQATG